MEHVYEIYIHTGGNSLKGSENKKSADPTAQEVTTEDNTATNQIWSFFKKTIVMGVAAQTVKWQVSLVGRNHGSALMQEKINAGLQIAGTIGAIGIAFAKGGIIGGTAAVAGLGIKFVKDIEQYDYNARWENIGLSLARERLGSSAAVNRSRNV